MMTWRPLISITALLCALALGACESSKSSPTGPSGPDNPAAPAPTIPSSPDKPAVVSIDIPARTATLSFRAVANSPRYVIEIGTSPGNPDVAKVTTDEGTTGGGTFTRTFTDLPAGFLYVRAHAQNQAGTSNPSPDLQFLLQDMKYLTETLFLQTGPYGGPGSEVVRGFRAGTHVRIRVSNTVTAEQRRGIDGLVAQLGETGARLTASVETINSNRPLCARNEIYIVTENNACATGLGCINTCPPATINTPWETATVFLGTAGQGGDWANIAAHELSHALLGLYHVAYLGVEERPTHPAFFGTPEFPHLLMYWTTTRSVPDLPRLSDLELRAVQPAFRAGISAGMARSDLRARGLIH